jgi:hypothetical protein
MNHEVIYGFRMGTRCSRQDLVKFPKEKLNCNSFYLIRAKLEFSIAITHEQRVLTCFLSWASLILILVNFHNFFGIRAN